ncbi:50S ribosomal protein L30 [Candidatus Micrarchaeota archaeon]|nr:50S ribosomal protein L30 [Candidatus Micrarchaeota archaeon]
MGKTEGQETGLIAVILVRGFRGMPRKAEETIKTIGLYRKHNCIFVKLSPQSRGMLLKSKDFITWGEVSVETVRKLLEKRGILTGGKPLLESYLVEKTSFKSIEELANQLVDGRASVCDVKGLKKVFRLSPPKRGFGSIKAAFPKGALGYRGKEINGLIEKML